MSIQFISDKRSLQNPIRLKRNVYINFLQASSMHDDRYAEAHGIYETMVSQRNLYKLQVQMDSHVRNGVDYFYPVHTALLHGHLPVPHHL